MDTGRTRKYLALTRKSVFGLAPHEIKVKLEAFKSLGGTVYVDTVNDRFILLDDRLPEDKVELAMDIFDGYPLETVELWVAISRHCDDPLPETIQYLKPENK